MSVSLALLWDSLSSILANCLHVSVSGYMCITCLQIKNCTCLFFFWGVCVFEAVVYLWYILHKCAVTLIYIDGLVQNVILSSAIFSAYVAWLSGLLPSSAVVHNQTYSCFYCSDVLDIILPESCKELNWRLVIIFNFPSSYFSFHWCKGYF